jgi:signal transduction histidine kinase/tetratricopeptide (TPR) repeat protein
MKHLFFLTVLFVSVTAQAQKAGQQLVDSLIAELPLIKNDTLKARTYNRIFNELAYLNIDEALLYARQGLQFARTMKWGKGVSVFQDNIGRVYSDQGNYDSAIFYYNASLLTNKDLGEKRNMASTYNNMGVAAQNIRSDYTTAAGFYFKALQLAEEIKDSTLLSGFLLNISTTYTLQKDFNKSMKFAERALLLDTKTGNADGMANSFSIIGNIKTANRELKVAEEYYSKAQLLYEQTGNMEGLASVTADLANVYGSNYRKAIEARMKARELWNQINPVNIKAIINTGNLGIVFLDIVRYDSTGSVRYGDIIPNDKGRLLQKAEMYLKEAIGLSERVGETDNRSYFLGALSELQAFKGDYKNAYYNFKLYKEVEDSIYSQENKNKIAAFESQIEIDKKNSELKINQLALSNQQKKLWGLAGAVLLVSVIGFLLYRQVQIKKKTNTVLIQLNRELDEANKVKAKFFSILSHDLRNPVARFITLLNLKADDPDLFNDAQSTAHQKEISQSATGLLETMEEMLLWSKGQMENFKPQIVDAEVAALFSYIERSFEWADNVDFNFSNPQNLTVKTDENYLQTIMFNLTSNAVKATLDTPGATVEWRAWEEKGAIHLSIADNGPGISEDQVNVLFSDASLSGGRHGLGLHIIKDLAKAIRCKITVMPAERGATFVLSLER